MFIVKANRPALTSDAENYTAFQCDYYVVAPSTANGTGPPGKPYIPPQKAVELYASEKWQYPAVQIAFLEVGLGEGQYCTVYVMNDRGKTIDTIQARES